MSRGAGTARRRVARLCMTGAMALAVVAVTAGPAVAGGSWLSPVRDRYEPGDSVTLVGYVGAAGSLGSIDDGPFLAYLRRPEAANDLPVAPFTPLPTDLRLGHLTVEPTGRADYTAYRVSIQFRLPSDLPPGRYSVSYCNATCTKGLTDLIGGVIFVGIDPDHPIGRTWPLDEPEIANLLDSAVLYGPGWQMTAREARARPPEPPPAPTTTRPPSSATAIETERAAQRVQDSDAGELGAWGWALLAISATALAGSTGFLVVRARRR
jgi:hypothetical protein